MIFYLVRRSLIHKIYLMKKLLIGLSFIFLLSGCEKDYNEIINPTTNEYYVEWAGLSNQDTIDIIVR